MHTIHNIYSYTAYISRYLLVRKPSTNQYTIHVPVPSNSLKMPSSRATIAGPISQPFESLNADTHIPQLLLLLFLFCLLYCDPIPRRLHLPCHSRPLLPSLSIPLLCLFQSPLSSRLFFVVSCTLRSLCCRPRKFPLTSSLLCCSLMLRNSGPR